MLYKYKTTKSKQETEPIKKYSHLIMYMWINQNSNFFVFLLLLFFLSFVQQISEWHFLINSFTLRETLLMSSFCILKKEAAAYDLWVCSPCYNSPW